MGIGIGPGLDGSTRGIGIGPGWTGVTSGMGTGLGSAAHREMHAVVGTGASVSLGRSLCDFTSSTCNCLRSLAVAGGPTNRATVTDALPSNTIRLARLTIAPRLAPLYIV
jgi:hypothetical protein